MTIITLTTDFGEQDGYVGMMKGVIYSINPSALIVDISHRIEPQNIAQGAFLLETTHRHFPPGTIHVGVVDPGVGTERRAICLQVPEIGYFIGPDNGLFSYILDNYPGTVIRELTNPAYHRQFISHTFHGRDIFAPVAAHLSRGEPFAGVGPLLESSYLEKLTHLWPEWLQKGKRILEGRVMYIDHFGNIKSNIHRKFLLDLSQAELKRLKVYVGSNNKPLKKLNYGVERYIETKGLKTTFGEAQNGEIIALFGSDDFLELAQVNGNAAEKVVKLQFPFMVEL